MPYKNPTEHFYPQIGVKISKKDESALYEAMQSYVKEHNITLQQLLRQSTREKLIREGYILESDK